MWHKFYDFIISNKTNNYKDYCVHFCNKYGFIINDKQVFLDQLYTANDFFPVLKNITNSFNNGTDLNLLINFFYYHEEIDLGDIILIDTKKYDIFNENSNTHLFSFIQFLPEILLSEDNEERTLTYLFIYFFPNFIKGTFLYHFEKKIPLISFSNITDNHFDLLLFLFKQDDFMSFKYYCLEYNLNMLLLENFMDNATFLYSFTQSIDWHIVLPLYKIKKLLNEGCSFKDFDYYRNKKHFYIFENLTNELLNIEINNKMNNLNILLPNKKNKTELIKI